MEVGTGFHNELTGKENIMLNGAVLGMSKKEILKKFDEIVEFSGVENFLDTPVKRYSSGMYVRLGFAVAAHLETEVLIIDEVLAVGDFEFQKKCLGKMEDVSKKEGRTVLFVSHNMNAIEQLCNCAMTIEQGNLRDFSRDVRSVIKKYLFGESNNIKPSEWINSGKEFDNQWFRPERISILDSGGLKLEMPAKNDNDFWIQIEGAIKESHPSLTLGYAIFNEENNLLYWSYCTDIVENKWPKLKTGKFILSSKIPKRFLNEGLYRIDFISSLHFKQWICQPGISSPSIYLTIRGGLSDSPFWIMKRPGILAPVFDWEIKYV